MKKLLADTWTDSATGIKWTYTVKNGKATVGTGSEEGLAVSKSTTGAITIPSTLGGHPVTSIGEGAFGSCYGLTSVTIPSGVTSIGRAAFFSCSELTSVTIPSGVTSIGDSAFSRCRGLVEILVAAGNKHYTSEDGVLFNKSKTEIVAYPCAKSGHYAIPSGVTSIGDDVFDWCDGLTSVTIPSSVTSIRGNAFSHGRRLVEILVADDNRQYTSEDGVLFNKSKTEIVACPCGKSGQYAIPSGVTKIGKMAFGSCYKLTSVTIPSGVTSIGGGAFFVCGRLTSVTIPSGVTSIGECAFVWCVELTSVAIPSSVTSIGEGAFEGCNALKTVYVAKGDVKRVTKMLEASGLVTSKVTFVENLDSTSGSES